MGRCLEVPQLELELWFERKTHEIQSAAIVMYIAPIVQAPDSRGMRLM